MKKMTICVRENERVNVVSDLFTVIRTWAFFAFFLMSAPLVQAQTLEKSERIGEISSEQVMARARAVFGEETPAISRVNWSFYRVIYRSRGARNQFKRLSGLLAIPAGGASKGLVLWHHGTISDPKNAPSQWKIAEFGGATEIALWSLASGDYAVAMPDYPGFGADLGSAHPYPMGRPNALASVDMIGPSRVIARLTGRKLGPNLFLGGYSQGGAAALWSARILQGRGVLPTRTAALSGPYDLSRSTLQPLLATPRNDRDFAAQLFLASWMAHNYAKASATAPSEIFRPVMALAVRAAFNTPQSESESVQGLMMTAKLMRARSLKDVLTPQFFEFLRRGDVSHPLVAQLRDNDVYNWAPRSPTLLWALESDEIVSVQNTRRALQFFRANGVSTGVARALILSGQRLDHVRAFRPALLAQRRFFDRGFAGVPQAR